MSARSCENVAMENTGDDWHASTAKRIGTAIARRRKHLGMTAQQLAEHCAELGVPIHRTTITKVENGRPRFDLGELIVIAEALGVAPVALIYPHMPDGEIERLPNEFGTSAAAIWWFTGEHDDPDEPAPGDLNRLLRLTRDRYKKMVQMQRVDDLLFLLAQRGQDIGRSEFSLLNELIDETNEIERRISEIPVAKLGDRGRGVPIRVEEGEHG